MNYHYLTYRFGKTLIVEEVDNINPVLFPLLRADLVSQGGTPARIPLHVTNLIIVTLCEI